MLEESKHQALVAIDFYNRAGDKRSLYDFVIHIHMHLAWLHLLHAEFEQAGTPYVYRDNRGRIIRVDGEPKTWDLERCLTERYTSNDDPVRANLEFFIALRNRSEHRYQRSLAAVTSGISHALVIKYEAERVARFGREHSLAGELRFSVFLEAMTPAGVAEMRKAMRALPADTRSFLTRYRGRLDPAVRDSHQFDYRLMLTPLKGPRSDADLVSLAVVPAPPAPPATPATTAPIGAPTAANPAPASASAVSARTATNPSPSPTYTPLHRR